MVRKLTLASFIAVAAFSSAQAKQLLCDITLRQFCDANGCKQLKSSAWNVIDLERGTFQRCDPSGCNTYSVTVYSSGAYTNIAVERGGIIAKLRWLESEAFTDSKFMEIATFGNTAYISFGKCR